MSERTGVLPEGARYIHQTPATPLVPVSLDGGLEIWCKLEFMNPSGSTKDRIARNILEKGWRSGRLGQGELFGSNIECCSLKFSSDVPGVAEDISEIYSSWECHEFKEWEIGDASCLDLTRKLWAKGVPVGPSSGLNFAAALKVAEELGPGSRVVTVFPDRMERHFSHKVFDGYRA